MGLPKLTKPDAKYEDPSQYVRSVVYDCPNCKHEGEVIKEIKGKIQDYKCSKGHKKCSTLNLYQELNELHKKVSMPKKPESIRDARFDGL